MKIKRDLNAEELSYDTLIVQIVIAWTQHAATTPPKKIIPYIKFKDNMMEGLLA